MPLNPDELRAIADAGRRNGWTPEELANAVDLDPDRVESWTLEGIIDQAEREGDDPGWIFELLSTSRRPNPIEFVDQGISPLSGAGAPPGSDPHYIYIKAYTVYRFAMLDMSLSLPKPNERYFVPTTTTVRTSPKTGRTLKIPKIYLVPGAANGTIAFIDWHPYGRDGVYIDYVRVRSDLQHRGIGEQVARGFYDSLVAHGTITFVHWGRVLNEHAWRIMKKMQVQYPSIHTTGNIHF